MCNVRLTTTMEEFSRVYQEATENTQGYCDQMKPYYDWNFKFDGELLNSLDSFAYNLPDYLYQDECLPYLCHPIETYVNSSTVGGVREIEIILKYYHEEDIPLRDSLLMELRMMLVIDESGRVEYSITNRPEEHGDGSSMSLNPIQTGLQSVNGSFDQDLYQQNLYPDYLPQGLSPMVGGNTSKGESGSRTGFELPARVTFKDSREKEFNIPYLLKLKLEKAHVTNISGFSGNGVYLNTDIKNGVPVGTQIKGTYNNTGYSLSKSGAELNVSLGNFSISGGGTLLGTQSGYSITKNGITSEYNMSLQISPTVPLIIGIITSGQWYVLPATIRFAY